MVVNKTVGLLPSVYPLLSWSYKLALPNTLLQYIINVNRITIAYLQYTVNHDSFHGTSHELTYYCTWAGNPEDTHSCAQFRLEVRDIFILFHTTPETTNCTNGYNTNAASASFVAFDWLYFHELCEVIMLYLRGYVCMYICTYIYI